MGFPVGESKGSIRANFKQVLQKLLGATVAFLLVCLPLFSQSTQGTIQGAVTDQTGGVLVGAGLGAARQHFDAVGVQPDRTDFAAESALSTCAPGPS